MKIQCVVCKEIVPIGTFRTSSRGIHVTCQACEEEFFVESGDLASNPPDAADSAADPADQPGHIRCPKCGAGQPEAAACRVCGLRTTLFDDFVVEDDEEGATELQLLWDALVSNWDDADAHKSLLEAVAAASQFSWGARRYREFLRQHPGDATCATQLERIVRMAEVTLAVTGPSEASTGKPYKSVLLLLIVLVLLAGLGGLYFLFKVKAREQPQRPEVTPGVKFVRPPVHAPTPTR